MRRWLEGVAVIGLGVLWWETSGAFFGADRLPARIPIHFDHSGSPNGWGGTSSLLILPLVTLGLYALITIISMFPKAFHFPVSGTGESWTRIEHLTHEMIPWLKTELVWLVVWFQWFSIDAARTGRGMLPELFPLGVVAVLGTAGWYLVAIFYVGRGNVGGEQDA